MQAWPVRCKRSITAIRPRASFPNHFTECHGWFAYEPVQTAAPGRHGPRRAADAVGGAAARGAAAGGGGTPGAAGPRGRAGGGIDRCRRGARGARPRGGPCQPARAAAGERSEEHTSELQSQSNLVCRLLLEKKK